MKKIILLIFFILIACTIANNNTINSIIKKENENCLNMKKFKVFQVFENNYALAHECLEDDDKYCSGLLVLLYPNINLEYYDDMYVTLPKDKCAIQDGVYRYETQNNVIKTVPIIYFGYKFEPESEEEFKRRAEEFINNINYICKMDLSGSKNKTQENIKKCDCVTEYFSTTFKNASKGEINIENFQDSDALLNEITKKCGDIKDLY